MSDELQILEDAAPEAEVDDYATKKLRAVWMLLGYSAILGVIECFLPEENSPIDVVLGVPALVLAIWWCFLDADERGDRIGGVLKWILILFFYVGFPIYVFRSRSVRGFVTLAHAFLLVCGMVVCMISTATITLFVGHLFGWWDLGM
ncbi:MAG: hypothetical protein AB7G28_16455 [Pirellulales bacterium]